MNMRFGLGALAVALGLVLASQSAALAQRGGGGGFGGGNSSIQLLGSEQIQKELAITSEQLEKIKTVQTESRELMQKAMEGLAPFNRDATPEERTAAMEERRKKMEPVTKEIQSKLDAVLTDKQKTRLKEIAIQVQGNRGALQNPDVVAALKITDEQKTKIEKIGTELREEMRNLRGGGGGRGGEAMQELMAESETRVMAVLTAEQKETLEKLKGAKIEIDRTQLRGGRGQGGPGGAGGAGGRQRGNNPPADPPAPKEAPKADAAPEL